MTIKDLKIPIARIMNSLSLNIDNFSSHLFWDIDKNTFSFENNKGFIVKRILEYGLLDDWIKLNKFLDIKEITSIAKRFKKLDKRAVSFIATISNTPMKYFKCYTTKQSTPQHWDF